MPRTYQATVIGAGYVGLATAVGLATRACTVDLVEVRQDRLASLEAGELPIHEPGMQAAFADPGVRSRIKPTSRVPDPPCDLVLICVGTPVGDDGRSDLTQLRSALESARPLVQSGAPLVIRSTLPVGSNDQVIRWSGCPTSRIFTNPEFLTQGRALEDFLEPSRVVVGTFSSPDPGALAMVKELLGSASRPLLCVSAVEADLIKNGANAFLALKISFANELSVLCEELDADALKVIEGIGLDPRIGNRHMQPGFGFGGSCLPKDLRSITNVGRDFGVEMHVTSAASEANEAHQRRFARRVAAAMPKGTARVAMLGLAFKAGTDDVRASPALRVAELLIARGLEVVAFDPVASVNAQGALKDLIIAHSAEEALAGAGVAVIATEWPEFRDIDWQSAMSTMAAPIILDGRRLLDPAGLRRLGYRYDAIGLPSA